MEPGTECVGDVVVAFGRQTEPSTHEGDRVPAALEAAPRRIGGIDALVAMRVEAEGLAERLGIVGARSFGALELVEAHPQVVHPRQRMALGQLDHDPAPGMCREGRQEGAELGHVVRDVATDGDVGHGGVGCDVGPASEHAGDGETQARRPGGDRLEHVDLTVDRDQAGAAGCQRQAGRSASHPHVEHRARIAERLECP